MLFNSLSFMLLFILVLVLHYLPRLPWKIKKTNLLLASYLFYAAWNPPFVLLLWISTLIDFFVGRRLYFVKKVAMRRLLLALSLMGNLGLLAFFKYGGFMLDNFVQLLALGGIDFTPAKPDIILPVGISFYTFQTLSYTLDIYRRNTTPEKHLLDFALYVTFFPQLVAGPIVRPDGLLPQFKEPKRAGLNQFFWGLFLLTLGLFMKIVLADVIMAGPSDQVFGAAQLLNGLDAWVGVLAFSGQIFFDFAGYSTCAIGVAACLGFYLPDNFRYPYAAVGFSDFWQRWHISLSSWLRDYLYIPLGGNRKGPRLTYANLLFTMLIGGLWHGAAWTFVVWGGLHGLYLMAERLLKGAFRAPPWLKTGMAQFGLGLFTFFLVNITWVFFRATDFSGAWRLLQAMFGGAPEGAKILYTLNILLVLLVVAGMVAAHWIMRNRSVLGVAGQSPAWATGISWAGMLLLILWAQKTSESFIYFQF
jgi:alginate O-acetyltransferase complex protein AlgI